jgi:hypothetical protein
MNDCSSELILNLQHQSAIVNSILVFHYLLLAWNDLLNGRRIVSNTSQRCWSFILEIPSRLGENYSTGGEVALLMEGQSGESVKVRIV